MKAPAAPAADTPEEWLDQMVRGAARAEVVSRSPFFAAPPPPPARPAAPAPRPPPSPALPPAPLLPRLDAFRWHWGRGNGPARAGALVPGGADAPGRWASGAASGRRGGSAALPPRATGAPRPRARAPPWGFQARSHALTG